MIAITDGVRAFKNPTYHIKNTQKLANLFIDNYSYLRLLFYTKKSILVSTLLWHRIVCYTIKPSSKLYTPYDVVFCLLITSLDKNPWSALRTRGSDTATEKLRLGRKDKSSLGLQKLIEPRKPERSQPNSEHAVASEL